MTVPRSMVSVLVTLLLVLLAPRVGFPQTTWDTVGDGNWQDGVNWSTGVVPQAGEDVVIDQGGGFLVTIGAAIPSINTMMSEEDISVAGGDLVMTLGGTINGSLTLGTNTDLVSNGGTFNANGATVLDGGNVFANGGATMNLATVGSYLTDTGSNSNRTLQADEASLLDLSNVSTITGGGFIRMLSINSRNASLVNLSGLTDVAGGAVVFEARDAGSVIDISSLATFNDTNGNRTSGLHATGGGIVNASNLTTLTADSSGGGNSIEVDGATSSVNVSSLVTMRNTFVELTNSGTVDLAGVTDITGSSFSVNDGVTLTLPSITSFVTDGGGNGNRNWTADGAGSQLDGSNISTAEGGGFIRVWNVLAVNDGSVDLSAITALTVGASTFTVDGPGSSIDISSLQTFSNTNGNRQSGLIVRDGGTIDLPLLTTLEATEDKGNSIIVDGAASDVNVPSLVTMRNTLVELTNGGTVDLAGVTDITGSSFSINDGVTLTLPSITSFVTDGGGNLSRNWTADGAGSQLDGSNISTAEGGGFIRVWNIKATDGGSVDLSSLVAITTGASTIIADGPGSLIDLSTLQTINGDNTTRTSLLEALDGGMVNLIASGTTQLTNVTTTIDSGGTINADQIELIGVPVTSSDNRAVIRGSGTITADLTNTSGVISPGLSVGHLTIDGDLASGAGAGIDIELAAVGDNDLVTVEGLVSLAGNLSLALLDEFVPAFGDEFVVLDSPNSLVGQFDTVGGVQVDTDKGLAVIYDADQVRIVTVLMGDANLNGVVDGQDFLIWNASKFQSGKTWSSGDFNGDGVTDGQDFLLWNDNKFTSLPSAVPEPASGLVMLMAACGLLLRHTRA